MWPFRQTCDVVSKTTMVSNLLSGYQYWKVLFQYSMYLEVTVWRIIPLLCWVGDIDDVDDSSSTTGVTSQLLVIVVVSTSCNTLTSLFSTILVEIKLLLFFILTRRPCSVVLGDNCTTFQRFQSTFCVLTLERRSRDLTRI